VASFPFYSWFYKDLAATQPCFCNVVAKSLSINKT
jgi:hypothetical protein